MTLKEIDPRLDRIYHYIIPGTVENLCKGLETINLVEPIPENDWQICSDLTEKGFYLITDAISVGLEYVFKKSRITFPPSIYFDEKTFAEIIVKESGIPLVNIENNQIDIRYENTNRAPIKFIHSFLNPYLELPIPRTVKNIEVHKQGILISNHALSYN